MLVPLTIYPDELPRLKALVRVVSIEQSAVIVNMYDAICEVENEQDVQMIYIAGKEMMNPKKSA